MEKQKLIEMCADLETRIRSTEENKVPMYSILSMLNDMTETMSLIVEKLPDDKPTEKIEDNPFRGYMPVARGFYLAQKTLIENDQWTLFELIAGNIFKSVKEAAGFLFNIYYTTDINKRYFVIDQDYQPYLAVGGHALKDYQ